MFGGFQNTKWKINMKQMSCLSNSIIRNTIALLIGKTNTSLKIFCIALALCVLPTYAAAPEPVLPAGLRMVEQQDEFLLVAGDEGQGICSSTGKLIIAPKFNDVRYVGDRLFSVAKYNDDGSTARWLLDDHGETIARLPEWARTDNRRFCEGLLNIGDSYSPTAFIDRKGQILPRFDQYVDVKEFSYGLAEASFENREGRWSGYVNHRGKMVIGPFLNCDLTKFENGMALVSVSPPRGKPKVGVVSSTGTFILPLIYESVSPMAGGKYVVRENNKSTIIDARGKVFVKFPPNCTSVQPPEKWDKNTWIVCGFSTDTARKTHSAGGEVKWGYCDINGKVVISPRFSSCYPFIGNRAIAYKGVSDREQVCGIIDRKGNWIVEPKYQYISMSDETHWTLGPLSSPDKKNADAGSNPYTAFDKVLRDYNLIGMSVVELEKHMGKLESPPYLEPSTTIGEKAAIMNLTPNATCGSGSFTLQIAFDANDKITGWRVTGGGLVSDSQPWITENVVVEDERKGFQLANLIPKP
ncbi:MAG: hypothetical protein C0507_12775 [Cyanobacteria bacterium PR.3.49]|nr:hypothetical protein [Cyanobacteria bacterium PR.3.49]